MLVGDYIPYYSIIKEGVAIMLMMFIKIQGVQNA